jgi:hypothetical protein
MVEEVEAPEGGPASERLGASALGGEDDLRAIPPGVEQGGNELGRVLEIRVHEDDHVAAGLAEAGLDGSLQAEVPREADDAQLAGERREGEQPLARAVPAAVVHGDDLEGDPEGPEGRLEALEQGTDRLLLVEHRDDHADQRWRGTFHGGSA